MKRYDALVAGAGIAGLSAAFHLARAGLKVALCDAAPPLSLTSAVSTECFRDVGFTLPESSAFMRRSIQLLDARAEETRDEFALSRRGYAYLFEGLEEARAFCHAQGGAATLLQEPAELARRFPYVRRCEFFAVLAPNAGWLSSHELGTGLLRDSGARVIRADVVARQASTGVYELSDGTRVSAGTFVNAAGPFAPRLAAAVDQALPPIRFEPEFKVRMATPPHVPAQSPLMIWTAPVTPSWTEEEARELRGTEYEHYTRPLPGGLHFRLSGPSLLALWTFSDVLLDVPQYPVEEHVPPMFAEVVARGLASVFAGFDHLDPKMSVDGGYYAKTADNLPLVGPTGDGQFVNAAYSGLGIMSAMAGGELLAARVTGSALPSYADMYAPSRYENAELQGRLKAQNSKAGQL